MSCHLSSPLFQRSFSFPVLMSNALVFIHAGFVRVTNFLSLSSSFCGTIPTFLFPFPSPLFFLSPFNSCPIIVFVFPLFCPISPLPCDYLPLILLLLSPTFFLTSLHSYSFHLSIPWSLFLSQGSVLEATVYGLEPYSQYSLRVEAVNEAGRLIMISASFKISAM